MIADSSETHGRRALKHAALGDYARLRIVDSLVWGEVSPAYLQELLGLSSSLLAHHLGVLEEAGIISRHRSEGDGRRSYISLIDGSLEELNFGGVDFATRVVFVCASNSGASQLASLLWTRSNSIPSLSAGTKPAAQVQAAAIRVAAHHGLAFAAERPRSLNEIRAKGDFIVTVTDEAYEQLGDQVEVHWSLTDPSRSGTEEGFTSFFRALVPRIATLNARLLPE